MSTLKLSVADPEFVDKIIFEVKSQGHFDMFRKECLADVGELRRFIRKSTEKYLAKVKCHIFRPWPSPLIEFLVYMFIFHTFSINSADTQPAYQNLHSRVEDSVQKFLNRQVWTPDTNKNRLREEMRHNIIRWA